MVKKNYKRKIQPEKQVIDELKKDENIDETFKFGLGMANVPLKLKSRFVPYIKMQEKARTFKIVQIEGNDYYEFEGLDGVYFNKDLFI